MILEILLLIIILLLLYLLFVRGKGPGIPSVLTKAVFVDAPKVNIKVTADTANQDIVVETSGGPLTKDKQLAFSAPDGKVEIRFNPRSTPFTGDTLISSLGGTVFSGRPRANVVPGTEYRYNILLTTKKGELLIKRDIRVIVERTGDYGKN